MEHGQDLEGRGCRVVMVGIGTEANAKDWMQTNKDRFPFPLLLDSEMRIHREVGLKRSVAGVWSIPVLIDFAEKLVANKLHVEHYDGDDLHILAGDFLTDSSGKLELAYLGSSSDDRPSVETILAALDKAAA